jgi:hypothetical protein
MTGRSQACWYLVVLTLAATLVGCGKSGAGAGSNAFGNAPAELKAAWDKAVSADQANDYVVAVQSYKMILADRDKLSEAQAKAVEQASGKLYQRLVDASGKGDPAAKAALSALTTGRGRGPGAPR